MENLIQHLAPLIDFSFRNLTQHFILSLLTPTSWYLHSSGVSCSSTPLSRTAGKSCHRVVWPGGGTGLPLALLFPVPARVLQSTGKSTLVLLMFRQTVWRRISLVMTVARYVWYRGSEERLVLQLHLHLLRLPLLPKYVFNINYTVVFTENCSSVDTLITIIYG